MLLFEVLYRPESEAHIAKLSLDIKDMDWKWIFQKRKLAHLEPVGKARQFFPERMNETGDYPDLIGEAISEHPLANGRMPDVRRVERTPKERDTLF
jgi:hypothetical protein